MAASSKTCVSAYRRDADCRVKINEVVFVPAVLTEIMCLLDWSLVLI